MDLQDAAQTNISPWITALCLSLLALYFISTRTSKRKLAGLAIADTLLLLDTLTMVKKFLQYSR